MFSPRGFAISSTDGKLRAPWVISFIYPCLYNVLPLISHNTAVFFWLLDFWSHQWTIRGVVLCQLRWALATAHKFAFFTWANHFRATPTSSTTAIARSPYLMASWFVHPCAGGSPGELSYRLCPGFKEAFQRLLSLNEIRPPDRYNSLGPTSSTMK